MLKEGVLSDQQKDPFRARHGANPTEGYVTSMSPLDHDIIRS